MKLQSRARDSEFSERERERERETPRDAQRRPETPRERGCVLRLCSSPIYQPGFCQRLCIAKLGANQRRPSRRSSSLVTWATPSFLYFFTLSLVLSLLFPALDNHHLLPLSSSSNCSLPLGFSFFFLLFFLFFGSILNDIYRFVETLAAPMK